MFRNKIAPGASLPFGLKAFIRDHLIQSPLQSPLGKSELWILK